MEFASAESQSKVTVVRELITNLETFLIYILSFSISLARQKLTPYFRICAVVKEHLIAFGLLNLKLAQVSHLFSAAALCALTC